MRAREDSRAVVYANLTSYQTWCIKTSPNEPVNVPNYDTYHEALEEFKNKYPRHKLWQLAVDGNLYSKEPKLKPRTEPGWHSYEKREPGCLTAIFVALRRALENLDDKFLSLSLIEELHGLGTNFYHSGKITPEAPGMGRTIGFPREYTTIDGYKDLLSKIENGLLGNALIYMNPHFYGGKLDAEQVIDMNSISGVRDTLFTQNLIKENSNEALASFLAQKQRLYFAPAAKDEQHALVEQVIDNYNSKINLITDPEEKLALIGNTIHHLELIHPFKDGNIRTFVIILLNRLLIQNGFPPATFFQPNAFDCFGYTTEILKRAIDNTMRIYTGIDLFAYQVEEKDIQFWDKPELKDFGIPVQNNPILLLLDKKLNKDEVIKALEPVQTASQKLMFLEQAFEWIMKNHGDALTKYNSISLNNIFILQSAVLSIVESTPFAEKLQTCGLVDPDDYHYFSWIREQSALKGYSLTTQLMNFHPTEKKIIPQENLRHKSPVRQHFDELILGKDREQVQKKPVSQTLEEPKEKVEEKSTSESVRNKVPKTGQTENSSNLAAEGFFKNKSKFREKAVKPKPHSPKNLV